MAKKEYLRNKYKMETNIHREKSRLKGAFFYCRGKIYELCVLND